MLCIALIPLAAPLWGASGCAEAEEAREDLETESAHPAGQIVAESTVDCVSADACTNIPRASKVSVRELARSAALVLSHATEVTTVIVNGVPDPSRLQVLLFAVIPPPGRLVGLSVRPSAPRITTI